MKKNILFCINNLQIGGAETLLVDIINNWGSSDNIHLIIFDLKKNTLHQKINKSHNFYVIDNDSTLKKIFYLRKYLVKEKIDVIIPHLERPNKIALLASLGLSIKVFPVIHSFNLYKSKSLTKQFSRFAYNFLPFKIIAVSDTVKNYLCNDMGLKSNKIRVVENGIDFSRIKLSSKKVSNDTKKFYTIGRLIDAKGYDFLLEALKDTSVINLNWELIMIGDGEMKTSLENQIIESNLAHKVKLLGKKNNPFDLIELGSFGLMPSIREGLSISLLEFMSKGIPVLTSDIKPFDLIKHNCNGFKFKSQSITSFVHEFKAICKLDNNIYREISRKSIETSNRYNIDVCVDNYKKTCYE